MTGGPSARLCRWRDPTIRILIVAPLLVTLAACGSTDPLADVQVIATLDRVSVVRSDSVRITLQVMNASGRTVRGVSPDSYGICFHAFRVFNSAQREVSVPTAFCIDAAGSANLVGPSPIEIQPGNSVTVIDYWKPGASTIDGATIPSGTYQVVGIYHADNRTLFSRPVDVTLLP